MNRLLWDENTSHDILRALRRARPDIDVVTVQQLGLTGADDEVVLSFLVDAAEPSDWDYPLFLP